MAGQKRGRVERRLLPGGGSFRAIVPADAVPSWCRLRVDLLVFCFPVLARAGEIYRWLVVVGFDPEWHHHGWEWSASSSTVVWQGGATVMDREPTPCGLCHSGYGDGAKEKPAGCRYPDSPKLHEAHARPNLARHPCAVSHPPACGPKSQDTESTAILANLSAAILAHHPPGRWHRVSVDRWGPGSLVSGRPVRMARGNHAGTIYGTKGPVPVPSPTVARFPSTWKGTNNHLDLGAH